MSLPTFLLNYCAKVPYFTQNRMSKTMRSLGKKIKGKKKVEDKEPDGDDYWY